VLNVERTEALIEEQWKHQSCRNPDHWDPPRGTDPAAPHVRAAVMARHGSRFHDAAVKLTELYSRELIPDAPEALIQRLFPPLDAEHRVRLAVELAAASGAQDPQPVSTCRSNCPKPMDNFPMEGTRS
jgi:hypothetical protein